MQLKAIIEGLLFIAGDDGLPMKQMAEVLEMEEEAVRPLMEEMKTAYQNEPYGVELQEVAGVFKLMTKPQLAPYIQRLIESPAKATLSQAALEALAIVAYKQPITRAKIEDIRGVKSDRPLQTLVAHALIKEEGRVKGPGRAILYATTDEFMEDFDLNSLQELPPFPEELEHPNEEEVELFESLPNKDEHRE